MIGHMYLLETCVVVNLIFANSAVHNFPSRLTWGIVHIGVISYESWALFVGCKQLDCQICCILILLKKHCMPLQIDIEHVYRA